VESGDTKVDNTHTWLCTAVRRVTWGCTQKDSES